MSIDEKKAKAYLDKAMAAARGNGISLGLLPHTWTAPEPSAIPQQQSPKRRVPQPQPAVPNDKRALTLKEAAVYLGCRLWHVRSLVWDGKLNAYYEGKRQVIDRADLDAHIEKQKRGA